MRATRKTNPNHKAEFSLSVQCICSCGWRSGNWSNTGAKRNAASEWRSHREKAECKAIQASTEPKDVA